MFGIYFGKYLMEEGILTKEQYEEVMEETKNSKVKMGLLAVEMGLMSEEETETVNRLQQTRDQRFGDIAIEEGYLTEEDVADILDRQGDPYLLFVQALVERGFLNMYEVREELIVYRKERGLSFVDMEALKTGDVDRITPIFLKTHRLPLHFRSYIMLTSRNIARFVDRFFRMEKMEKLEEIEVSNLAIQYVSGDYSFYTMFCGTQGSLAALANGFAQTAFEVFEDVSYALDATKEFLNCNNGLYLTEVHKKSGLNVALEFPLVKENTYTRIVSDQMYKIPYFIKDQEVDLILCGDKGFQME